MSRLDVEIWFEQNARVVNVAGDLDLTSVPNLEERVDETALEPSRATVLDLTAVTFIDSAGLALLLRIDRALEPLGRYLAIAAIPGPVVRALSQTGLASQFPIRQTVDAAIAAVI